MSRYDSGAYSRIQFLSAVSHSMGEHTESLRPTEDSSSSSSEDDDSNQAPPAEATVSTATRRDDCCEDCLVAPREGFALVPCGHARFCESCALRVADVDSGCPVCRSAIRMVMCIFS